MSKIFKKEEYYEYLKDKKKTWKRKTTNFTIFVGAGFSVNFGMPNWEGYALNKMNLVFDSLNDEVYFVTKEELKTLDKKHLLTLINGYLKEEDSKKYEKQIFKTNDERKEKLSNEMKKFIETFKNINASFVTTNYDNVLEDYFGFDKRNIFNVSQRDFRLNSHEVVHIHGDVKAIEESDRIISTWKDYYDLYFQNGKLEESDMFTKHAEAVNDFLKYLFSENEILVIGYSITEIEILKFIFQNRKYSTTNSNITIVHLKPDNAQEEVIFKLYEELGINVIFLNKDKRGYSVLFDFLEELTFAFPEDSINDDMYSDIVW